MPPKIPKKTPKPRSHGDYDLITLTHIPTHLFAGIEAGLYRTKWFDYREHHPFYATWLFGKAYIAAYSEAQQRRFDVTLGKSSKGVGGLLQTEPMSLLKVKTRVLSGLWKARQAADRLGIPYDFFCRQTIRYADNRGWKRLPQPHHLYSEPFLLEVERLWLDYRTSSFRLPEHRYMSMRQPDFDWCSLSLYLRQIVFSYRNPGIAIQDILRRDLLSRRAAKDVFGDIVDKL